MDNTGQVSDFSPLQLSNFFDHGFSLRGWSLVWDGNNKHENNVYMKRTFVTIIAVLVSICFQTVSAQEYNLNKEHVNKYKKELKTLKRQYKEIESSEAPSALKDRQVKDLSEKIARIEEILSVSNNGKEKDFDGIYYDPDANKQVGKSNKTRSVDDFDQNRSRRTVRSDGKKSSNNEITLIITADGKSKDEAIKNALRSAIEQTYGVFVSANTDILNDEVVKDEIATVASGNINSYKVLSDNILSPDRVNVTVEAVVSVNKLVSYAKSKGAECELDGNTLAKNIELELLYRNNEEKVIQNLISTTKFLLKDAFDYVIDLEKIAYTEEEESWCHGYNAPRPQLAYSDTHVSIPIKVSAVLNKTGEDLFKNFYNQLYALALPLDNKGINKGEEFRSLKPGGQVIDRDGSRDKMRINFRSKRSVEMLDKFFSYEINDGIKEYDIIIGEDVIQDLQPENRGRAETFGIIWDLNNWYGSCPGFSNGQRFYFYTDKIILPIDKVKQINKIKVRHK